MTKFVSKNRKKFYLKAHLVFAVKYRKKIIKGNIKNDIILNMEFISKKKDFIINEINSDLNHIHILISYEPKISISSIVRCLKQENTYFLWKKYNLYLNTIFFNKKTFWSDGYFVSSIGYTDEETIKEYIENQ